jgi:hypothetical protein
MGNASVAEHTPELIGVVAAARLLGVSEDTVRRNRWGIKVCLSPTGQRRYHRDDVIRVRDEAAAATPAPRLWLGL